VGTVSGSSCRLLFCSFTAISLTGAMRTVLGIPHPAADTRDVAVFLPFRRSCGASSFSPASFGKSLMGRNVGVGYEHPVSSYISLACVVLTWYI